MFFKWLESNFNAIFSGMTPQDRWGGPNADMTRRLVAADAHDEEYNKQELSDRLRDPNAHIVQMPDGHLRHSGFNNYAFNSPFGRLKDYLQATYEVNLFLHFWLHDSEEIKENPEEEKRLPYGQVNIVFEYRNVYDYDQSPPTIIYTVPSSRTGFNVKTTYDKVGRVLADQLVKEAEQEGADVSNSDPNLGKLVSALVNADYEQESPMERLKNFIAKRNVERAKLGKPELKLKNKRFDTPSE